MPQPPVFDLDPDVFHSNPYPILKNLRAKAPIAFVPALNAILITRRDDIFTLEKQIDVFSSDQPDGLMTKLMGQNMMRKDCLLYTSPSPRDRTRSRMPSSA